MLRSGDRRLKRNSAAAVFEESHVSEVGYKQIARGDTSTYIPIASVIIRVSVLHTGTEYAVRSIGLIVVNLAVCPVDPSVSPTSFCHTRGEGLGQEGAGGPDDQRAIFHSLSDDQHSVQRAADRGWLVLL
jgi:hypothetical protein